MSTTVIVPSNHHSQSYSDYIASSTSRTEQNEIVPYKKDISLLKLNSVPAKPHIHPKRKDLKKRRKIHTATGTIGGVILGGVTLGPLGMVVGGVAGAATVHKVGKIREKKAQRKYEKFEVQKQASQGMIHDGTFA
uniref:Glycine zipper domain-containing protein n=1 Tax=Eucampia antarctica TaxID=49252 RepID=A0A7S2WK18_9STRA|mmetsp:Transcript_4465/g.4231  ORF Transcript_4465/g.4231 Transcript_4465/m.4231 type:complete len:135 (+) Transcript_4465:207-611(+)